MKAIRVCVVVALVAVVLTGCKGPATDSPLAESAPSPSATSTPTQERETGLVAPKQVFGGDCNALFTADEVSEILGVPVDGPHAWVGPLPWDPVKGGPRYLEQHGGIRCSWADSEFEANVVVIALPESAVSYAASTACEPDAGFRRGKCALESVQNGIRLSGAVWPADGNSALLVGAQSALLDLFAQRAEGANVVPLPIPAVGAWGWPVDCASVVAAGDFSAVPGLGASVQGGESGGSDVFYPQAELALWGDLEPSTCGLRNGDVFVDWSALGGGRWAESQVSTLTGATTTIVDGIDTVVLSPEHEMTRVDAFDGPNWVTFYVRYPSNAGVMAQALVAALDTTAIE